MHQFQRGDAIVRLSSWPGPADADPRDTLLLVHGIGMGQQYFGQLRDELVKRFDVVAVDLPGFGDSPAPARPGSMADTAELLALALADAGLSGITAVGHSMGTQVVAELAASHPELVKLAVLIAPTVNASERTLARQAFRMLLDLANDPPVVALVGTVMYLKTGPRWYLAKFRSMVRHRIEWVAPNISQPTLVVRGDEDLVCPREWTQFVASLIPDVRYEEAKGKGHEAMITGAQPISRMINDFVTQRG